VGWWILKENDLVIIHVDLCDAELTCIIDHHIKSNHTESQGIACVFYIDQRGNVERLDGLQESHATAFVTFPQVEIQRDVQ
jgi:hypothetical protein